MRGNLMNAIPTTSKFPSRIFSGSSPGKKDPINEAIFIAQREAKLAFCFLTAVRFPNEFARRIPRATTWLQLSYAGRMKVREQTVIFSANWATRARNVNRFSWAIGFRFAKAEPSMRSRSRGEAAIVISLSPHNAICFQVSYSRCIAPRTVRCTVYRLAHHTSSCRVCAGWRIPRRKHDDTILLPSREFLAAPLA